MSNFNVQTFIINNIGVIVALIVAVLGLIQAIISKNKQQTYANIFSLVSDAEKLGNATGLEKFKYVFDAAYEKLPKFLKAFIAEDDIKRAIEYSLNKLKAFAEQQAKAESMKSITTNIVNNTNIKSPADMAAETIQHINDVYIKNLSAQ